GGASEDLRARRRWAAMVVVPPGPVPARAAPGSGPVRAASAQGSYARCVQDAPDTRSAVVARRVDAIDEVVWEATPGPSGRLRLTYVSPAVERLVGHPPQDLIGGAVRWSDLVDPEDRRRVRTQQLAALRGE